jgi:hypothetical protein
VLLLLSSGRTSCRCRGDDAAAIRLPLLLLLLLLLLLSPVAEATE